METMAEAEPSKEGGDEGRRRFHEEAKQWYGSRSMGHIQHTSDVMKLKKTTVASGDDETWGTLFPSI